RRVGFHGRRALGILTLFCRARLGGPARWTHLYPCTTGRSHFRRRAVKRLRWPSHLFVMKTGRPVEAANFSHGTFPVARDVNTCLRSHSGLHATAACCAFIKLRTASVSCRSASSAIIITSNNI